MQDRHRQGCANSINSQHFCLHSSILQGKKARAEGWVPSRAGLGCSAVMMMSRNSLVTTSPVSTLMEPRVLGLKTVSPWMSRASGPDCWDHSHFNYGLYIINIRRAGLIIRLSIESVFVHQNSGYIRNDTPMVSFMLIFNNLTWQWDFVRSVICHILFKIQRSHKMIPESRHLSWRVSCKNGWSFK